MQDAIDVIRPSRWRTKSSRKGATIVECAIVGPIALLLLIGFAVLTLGVYRYQEVSYLARAGARYASTHGAQYRTDNRLPTGTESIWIQDIRENGILPYSSVLAPSGLTVHAAWRNGDNVANAADWATSSTSTVPNAVTVTVTYRWLPEAFLRRPFTLTSSATMPMSY